MGGPLKVPMSEAEADREAWRRVCQAYTFSDGSLRAVGLILSTIEECRILFGDPNAAKPQGTITVRSKEIRHA